jgi:hypothetical protein
MPTNECRRYFFKNEGVIIPVWVRNITKTGNSKTIPEASVADVIEPMYEFRLMVFVTSDDML